MNKMHRDNRGLTLLELIVAVMILALLVSPLMHAFLTSAASARKTRALDAATNAATNIVESIKAESLDDIIERAVGGALYGATARVLPESNSEDGYYKIELSGLRYGTEQYSGELTLDARTYASSGGRKADVNGSEIVKYSFSGLRCGTEMSGVDANSASVMTGIANLAAQEKYLDDYASAAAAEEAGGTPSWPTPPSTLTTIDILGNMSRKLTITVEDMTPGETDPAKQKLRIEAISDYSYNLAYTGTVIELPAPVVNEFYGTYDAAVYFFFYPLYSNGKDEIVIKNNPELGDLELTFFLVKQRPLKTAEIMTGGTDTDMWMKLKDRAYVVSAKTAPFITLEQRGGENSAVLRSNLGVYLDETETPESGLMYREVKNGSVWTENKPLGNELVELITPDRLYELTLALTDANGETVEVKTTKLEFPEG